MKQTFRNHAEVCHIWAQQSQPAGKSGNIFFREKSIFSYGTHFEMARFVDGNTVLINSAKYSSSTGKHQSLVLRALKDYIKKFFVVSFDDHKKNIEAFLENATEKYKRSLTAIKYSDHYKADAIEEIENAKEYSDKFLNGEISQAIIDCEKLVSEGKGKEELLNLIKQEREIANKYRKEKEEKIKIEKERDIKEWREGTRAAIYCNYNLPVMLRLIDEGKTVESSHRAYVPTKEAIVLYHCLKHGKPIHGTKIGEYTVLSSNEKEIVIGCHHIPMAEIELLAKTNNW